MLDSTTVYQRTHAGREEIHQKKKGLTQSERLVLIMIDGVSTYSGVRSKLPVLTDDRFERAIRTLSRKELILEVFLPVEGEAPEEVERSVVDKFLQQDAMDPVTILVLDPDEQFGDIMPGHTLESSGSTSPPVRPPPAPEAKTPRVGQVNSQPTISQNKTPADYPRIDIQASPPQPVLTPATPIDIPSEATPATSTLNAEDEALADQIGRELRARQKERAVATPSHLKPMREQPEPVANKAPKGQETGWGHWSYWSVALGFAFLAGYALARLSS